MKKRILAVATALVVTATALSACTPTTTIVPGSTVRVAVATALTSVNASTSFGRSSPTNADVAYLTGTGFGYYDAGYARVDDTSFGSAEIVDESPFTVRYTIADGVTWSDGVPVDAADLLLSWAANSGSVNTPGFDDSAFVDPATGQYTDDFPDEAVFFDGTIGNGLELATTTPTIVEDRSLEVVYDSYFSNWRLALQPGVAAHVVAERALGLPDGTGDAGGDQKSLDAAMAAKAALVSAVVGRDQGALARLSRFWNSSYNLTALPGDPSLLVASGPYRLTGIDADTVTLTANPAYHGDRRPTYETIELRVSPDPQEAVDLLAKHEVDIVTPQPSEDVLAALVGVDDVTVTAGSEGTFEHLDLQQANSRSGVFDDQRVREAFLDVVPRQQILDELITPLQEDAGLLDSFLLRPGAAGYTEAIADNGSREYAETDVDKAVALLAEAGVAKPRVCILYDPANPRRVAEFTLIRTSAARAGFRVTDCSNPDWEGLLGVADSYDAALFAWDTTRLGPAAASAVFKTGSKLANFNGFSDPEVDKLIAQVEASDDDAEVTKLLTEIDGKIWADAYGVPLYAYPTVTAVASSVTGVTRSPLGRGVFWDAWKWAPAAESPSPG
ncbi:MAG: transporter family substrate-binding protein [Schumannella sp.]|nr:transporter family substrate-binding protein [Schumannella sp.]